MMILTFILFIATFGAGFTLKKKYRENNWLNIEKNVSVVKFGRNSPFKVD